MSIHKTNFKKIFLLLYSFSPEEGSSFNKFFKNKAIIKEINLTS